MLCCFAHHASLLLILLLMVFVSFINVSVVKAIRQALLLEFLFVSCFHFFLPSLNTAPAVFFGVFLRELAHKCSVLSLSSLKQLVSAADVTTATVAGPTNKTTQNENAPTIRADISTYNVSSKAAWLGLGCRCL